MIPARRLLPLLAALFLTLPAAARAQIWQPLETGFFWSYAGSSAIQVITVEGTVQILGESAWSVLYSPSTTNPDLRNFWTTGGDGDVFLHGFDNPTFAAWGYDPPIRVLDAPLTLGKTWQQSVDVYSLIDQQYLMSFDIAFEVLEEGVLAVPAGSFDTFGIGQVAPRLFTDVAGTTFGLDGSRIPTARGVQATRYYAANVGVVRDIADETYDLLAYGFPTDLTAETWAGVKSLYR